jgi:hypothetical protein
MKMWMLGSSGQLSVFALTLGSMPALAAVHVWEKQELTFTAANSYRRLTPGHSLGWRRFGQNRPPRNGPVPAVLPRQAK